MLSISGGASKYYAISSSPFQRISVSLSPISLGTQHRHPISALIHSKSEDPEIYEQSSGTASIETRQFEISPGSYFQISSEGYGNGFLRYSVSSTSPNSTSEQGITIYGVLGALCIMVAVVFVFLLCLMILRSRHSPEPEFDPKMLENLRIVKYSEICPKDTLCTICLESFLPTDSLRLLPCLHYFHQSCIDEWLQHKPHCPLCLQHISHARDMRCPLEAGAENSGEEA